MLNREKGLKGLRVHLVEHNLLSGLLSCFSIKGAGPLYIRQYGWVQPRSVQPLLYF
jgi:hypothetical protein